MTLVAVGDSAVRLEFDARIALDISAKVVATAGALRSLAIPGVRDVVPAYSSVTVYFDPLHVDQDHLKKALTNAVRESPSNASPGRRLEVPVCYGGELGPDLEAVAAFAGLAPDEVVARHAGGAYRVFMLGFVPGFAYMGLVDERIAAGRHDTPRTRVPGGSVGIAGRQTGVYPRATPGGWQIIGRTPVQVFDETQAEPCLFAPGDEVRFMPIDRAQFDTWSEAS